MTQREKARKILKEQDTGMLINMWEATTYIKLEQKERTRQLILDELKSRNPKGFERWLDGNAPDMELRAYVLNCK